MLKKLKKDFYFPFSQQIWNIIADKKGNIIILELREENSVSTSFAALDLTRKQIKWDNFQFNNNNWGGLTAIEDNILILHTFNDTDNPEDKSYFAIDIDQQKIIWKEEHFQLLGIAQGTMVGVDKSKEQDKGYKKIYLTNGKKALSDEKEVMELFNKASQGNNSLLLPYHYQQGTDYFNTTFWFLKTFFGMEPVIGLDYLEYYHLIIISFYLYENNTLNNYLMVFNQEGDPVLKEMIGTNLAGIGMDTFLVVNNKLILIKDKSQLLGYAL